MNNNNNTSSALVRLKSVQQRVTWGGKTSSKLYSSNLVILNDNEFVTLAGSNLLLFENGSVLSRKARIVETKDISVLYVKLICVSKDGKFLAAVLKLAKESDTSEINIQVYHTSNHLQENHVKSRLIKYSALTHLRPAESIDTTCVAFSHDSSFLACSTNITSIGIVIFEQYKGTVLQTISTESVPISISFHPADPNKVLATGEQNLVKFWKFTAKSVHIVNVVGLKRGSTTFTTHGWIYPLAENTIVVGTNTGFITTIQANEQRVQFQQAFGTMASGTNSIGVGQILVRGDHVIVSSTKNLIVLYELRRIVVQKYVGLTAILVPLKFYQISGINRICGLQFCFKDSITAYSLLATSEESVSFLDIVSDSDLNSSSLKPSTDQGDDFPLIDWKDVEATKILFSFHSGPIQSLNVGLRSKVFITSSFLDCSVRCWYYDEPSTFNSSWLIEKFHERIDENPFHVDLHPSGLSISFASESEVREYAICDNQLDLIRKFAVRNPFQGTSGIPVVITQSVSLVKYSQGGHLIAVVTGKIAQIFQLNALEDENSPTSGPFRVMTMCDHANPITDIVFFQNDSKVITTSSDGSVYSWTVGATTRSSEFVQKGLAASKIAVSRNHKSSPTIIVAFENLTGETGLTTADMIKRRRLSSFASRKISSSFSESTDIRGSKNTTDLAAIASAFVRDFETRGATPDTPAARPVAGPKSFVAMWTNDVSPTPTVIQVETPVRSIAIGRVGFPDSYDLCVLGLVDGRILISLLPLPYIEISFGPATPISSPFQPAVHKISRRRKGPTLSSASEFTPLDLGTEHGHHQHPPHSRSKSFLNFNNGVESLLQENSGYQEEVPPFEGPHYTLDESACRALRLAVGSVLSLVFSPDGNQIIAGAEDGSVHLLTTTKKFGDHLLEDGGTQNKEQETQGNCHFFMVEKSKMLNLRSRLTDLEMFIDHNRRDHEMTVAKIIETKDKTFKELETKLRKELSKRDESIIQGRKEYLIMRKEMHEEVEKLKKFNDDSLGAMELTYEKRLAHEGLYMEKMKQAYDEYVVHAKMDMVNLNQKTETRIGEIEEEKKKLTEDIEKQKNVVLRYYDYIQQRNSEVLQSLEEQQADER
jgi:WD40 repeat protein